MKKVLMFVLLTNIAIQAAKAQTATQATDTTITVKVKGLTCSNDLKTIASNVKEVKGVKECKAGKLGPTSSYKITYNLALVNYKDIVAAIENTPGCGDAEEKPYKVKNNK
jgi:copper chaperone CopZ